MKSTIYLNPLEYLKILKETPPDYRAIDEVDAAKGVTAFYDTRNPLVSYILKPLSQCCS